MRLDKYLSDMGLASRSDIKKEIRKGLVRVNGEIIRDSSFSVPLHASVSYRGEEVCYEEFSYYMMNKPIGVLSSTEDRKQKTVLDLITEKHRKDLFPVGRLDKDSEGLILIMNDGQLAHTLLSPKNHIEKRYYIEIPVLLEDSDIAPLRFGIQYDKDLIAEPAKVRVLSAEKEKPAIEIIITEGKFHQIKKMFLTVGVKVLSLKRTHFGAFELDQNLAAGEYRALNQTELEKVKQYLEKSY